MSLSLFTYYLDETNRLIKEATSITNFDEPEINLSLVRDKLVGTSSIIDLIIGMTNNNRNFEKFQIDVVSICQSMIIRLTQTLNNKIKSKINYKKDNKENNSNCNNYYDKNGSNYSKNSQNIQNYNLLPHSFKFTGSPRLFIDIAGNQIPKQVLWENIILPFKMPTEIRQKLFVGIRKMLGNVLLYGPPGNGKTVLAKVNYLYYNVIYSLSKTHLTVIS
jgi:Cdc6-like AAA superfamily ATPase